MSEYVFWYSETVTYKAGLKADSYEEARALIGKVLSGETALEDLPEFWNKEKGYEFDYSPETLHTIDG